MNRTTIAAICLAIGSWLMIGGGGTPGPGPSPTPSGDVLAECHAADRVSKVALIREMASKEFASDQAQADWWNDGIEAARSEDFQPFVDAVSEAIVAEKLTELADSLEPTK